ncbi:hypothetical protein [Cribrihabitans pelagius]|uniref:hypothetical protein n=1 Tax=Cribrihabitans pelagius TaxID=1765746 RepID=UPI003B5BF656
MTFGKFLLSESSARPAGRALLAAAVLTLSASPALALSCVPWGVQDAYLEAAESEHVYNVIAGALAFDEEQLPRSHSDNPGSTPELTRVPAQLSGKMLAGGAFSEPVDVPVTLEVECLGPWCGGIVAGEDHIFFAEQRGDELVVRANACGGWSFADTPKARRQVLSCHGGGECVPKMPR